MPSAERELITMTVPLAERSYPLYIGEALLQLPALLSRHLTGKQAMVVTQEALVPLYLDTLAASLPSDLSWDYLCIADGESYKNLDTLSLIFDSLLEKGHGRQTTLIALGGGIVGDVVGFAAACYLRGVDFIQIPTTLLAQVDSSVGGKTGVNHPLGKNLIGAFYQPKAVLMDVGTLKSLPQREYNAGMAEVVKYGLIHDADFFHWIQTQQQDLQARDTHALIHAIARSCEIKAEIVALDERESGVRALLNFGHTFGHAIEYLTGYERFLHGEAVAIGMCMAACLSRDQGWITASQCEAIQALLTAFNLPTTLGENFSREHWFEAMARDKKVILGQLRWVVLQSLGQGMVTAALEHQQVWAAICECNVSC